MGGLQCVFVCFVIEELFYSEFILFGVLVDLDWILNFGERKMICLFCVVFVVFCLFVFSLVQDGNLLELCVYESCGQVIVNGECI